MATGCASVTPKTCALVGGLAGAAGGATYGTNNDKGHDIDSAVGYGAAIGVASGTAAYFLCKALGVGEAAPAPEPAPAPAPAPEPAPPPPAEEPAPAPQAQRIVLRGVQFEFDKADIRPDAAVILDEAANQLGQVPGARVSVEGHTDSVGADAYNQSLSERRAGSVRDYLVEKGVDASRLSVAGYGESQPVADNATAEGRALNRRVELKVQE
ncbi:MAG TPA: OmpA family protein [Myxococcota bacterium]|nr:OmpA family protein [Myxococcota bacterium]